MKYIIQSIINEINSDQPSDRHETMVKINGFENLKVYHQIAVALVNYFHDKRGLNINIKLAKTRWEEFQTKEKDTTILNAMKQNGWISEKQSITYYRNLHSSDILVLMGTENEEDADGLANCSTIDPTLLVQRLNGHYSQVYTDLYSTFSSDQKKMIDTFYKFLFEFVSIDICKLSDLIDEEERKVTDDTDIIKFFYESLPQWGLPKNSKFPLKLRGKKNILRPEYKFISRADFKNLTKGKYNKYVKKIDDYNAAEESEYNEDWHGWKNQSIKSYKDLKKVLLEFIRGEDVFTNRNKLLDFDFSIVDDIFNFKPGGSKSSTTPNEKIIGEPLYAFSHLLMETMAMIKGFKTEQTVSTINVEFKEASIAIEPLTDDANDQHNALKSTWKAICEATNGVFNYINRWDWSINDTDINIVSEPDGFLDPEKIQDVLDIRVTAADLRKSISEVKMVVHCLDENGEEVRKLKKKYSWLFTADDIWSFELGILCRQDFVSKESPSLIPLVKVNENKLTSLTYCKTRDEFAETLKNVSYELDFSYDIEKFVKKNLSAARLSNVKAGFIDLGDSFTRFAQDLSSKGLYELLNTTSSSLNAFVKAYDDLGKLLVNTDLNDDERFLLNAYIHAFNIEDSSVDLESEINVNRCVVPVWHPAVIQKIANQKVFFLDGCQEWWDRVCDQKKAISKTQIGTILNELQELCRVRNAVDLFPGKSGKLYGNTLTFGGFSIYASNEETLDSNIRDIIKKDAIFDDDFSYKELTQMNDNAQMIYDVLNDYKKSFSTTVNNLNLVFVNPTDLQPLVSAVSSFVSDMTKANPDIRMNISIKIMVKPENKGGKNYLSYWMNEFFQEEDNVNIKTYLNEWESPEKLDEMLDNNNDIIFVMGIMQDDELRFATDSDKENVIQNNECYYPIIYKPLPISRTNVKKRQIEISQPQFSASYIHTQVVYYRNHFEDKPEKKYIAIREIEIDDKAQKILDLLHEKSYWVVCVDSGIDGALLKNGSTKKKYPIIGFSTGKGSYGQYNVTITSRKSILKSIRNKFSNRLEKLFKWPKTLIDRGTDICLREAASLDGISLFSAINSSDHNINEFMAYVLTSLREKKSNNSPLKVIIHLDSYKHWFKDIYNNSQSETQSRPDFLMIEVDDSDESDNLQLKATVIECKIASINHIDEHRHKAIDQLINGMDVLSMIFDPDSQSIKRRYWYAQLYRALVFAQVSFEDSSDKFKELSLKLRSILLGNFDITWSGKMLGYWLDMGGKHEIVKKIDDKNITLVDIPQEVIQSILLEDTNNVSFVSIDSDTISRDEADEALRRERQNEIEKAKDRIHNRDFAERNSSSSQPLYSSESAATSESMNIMEEASQSETVDESTSESLSESVSHSLSLSELMAEFDDIFAEPDEEQTSESYAMSTSETVEDSESDEASELTTDTSEASDVSSKLVTDQSDTNDVSSESMTDQSEVSDESKFNDIRNIRIWIGKDKYDQDIYWDFGNKGLNNRHLLITGTSGQGKTYGIQAMLYELMKTNISAVAFDYTEGFRKEQLDPTFVNELGDKFNEIFVYDEGVPINPFERNEIEIHGHVTKEKTTDIATRIASIFTHVYKLGDQQRAVIYRAVRDGYAKYGDDMNMSHFKKMLEDMQDDKTAKTVFTKLELFFDSVEFRKDPNFTWEKLLYNKESNFTIFQLTMIDQDIQVIITELLLWDAYYFTKKYGNKDKPFVVILDEAQNLSHKKDSPSGRILIDGRKFGWSAWFATQSLNVLSDDEITRLSQAGFHLYFKPANNEMDKTAKQIDASDPKQWLVPLKSLGKGQCIVQGDRTKPNGQFGPAQPVITKVASFEMRKERENGKTDWN